MVIRLVKRGSLGFFLGLFKRDSLGRLLRWLKGAVYGGY